MSVWFVWLIRLMFIGIFPLAAGMLHRGWKIAVRKDLRYVSDWRGRTMQDGKRWAKPVLAINVVSGFLLLGVGCLVLLIGLPLAIWSSAVAFILWSYYFALHLVVRRDKLKTAA